MQQGTKVTLSDGQLVNTSLFETLTDCYNEPAHPEDELGYSHIVNLITGAYTPLPGFQCGAQFMRETQSDFDEDGGFTRVTYLPMLWSREKVLRVLDNSGWPTAGVNCRHEYDCGQLYCEPVSLAMTEQGIKAEQRVYRNW